MTKTTITALEQAKINRLRAKERKLERLIAKDAEKSSIYEMCKQVAAFYNDKRYAGIKAMLTMRMNIREAERERLINSDISEFNYLRKQLICDIEINLINDILNMPENHAKKLEEMQKNEFESKEKDNGKHV